MAQGVGSGVFAGQRITNPLSGQKSMLNAGGTGPDRFGRLPGEMNIDFLKRDPQGYKRWYSETKGGGSAEDLSPQNISTPNTTYGYPTGTGGAVQSSRAGGTTYDDRVLDEITKASQSTQASAGADREAAIAAIKSGKTESLAQYGDIDPNVINERVGELIYGKGRDQAEAQTASMLRNLQNQYYSGSPSGALREQAKEINLAKMGTLAGVRRDVEIGKAEKNFASKFALAKEKAGIYERGAGTEANILGNTIATVPDLTQSTLSPSGSSGSSGGDIVSPTSQVGTQDNYSPYDQYGRLPGEMNIDFLKRDPSAYKQWYSATGGAKGGTFRI